MTDNAISDLVGVDDPTPVEPQKLEEASSGADNPNTNGGTVPNDAWIARHHPIPNPNQGESTQSPLVSEPTTVSTEKDAPTSDSPLESGSPVEAPTLTTAENTGTDVTKDTDNPLVQAPAQDTSQDATTPVAVVNEPDPAQQSIDKVMEAINRQIGGRIGETSTCKVCIYSPPGQGKSSIAATAPNSLIWDFEDGLLSAAESPYGIAPGVRPMRYVNFKQAEAVVTKFEEQHPDLAWVKLFCIDTYSDFVRRTLTDICERDWRNAPAIFNRYKPNTDQYTENNEMHDRFVRRLRDLTTVDLLIMTHDKTVEPKNKPAKTYPDFSESFANRLEAKMDVVGYLQMEEVDGKPTPVMITRSTTVDLIHCKRRIDIPDRMVNPTWPEIKEGWERTQAKIRAMQEAEVTI